jgi:carboxymethylenebutenolidase
VAIQIQQQIMLLIGAVFDEHVKCEFVTKDVEATMRTMVKEPYVHHVPVLTGGVGYEGVYNFYKNDFVGKMPDDVNVIPLSRTVGKNQVVDELILSFTHDRELRPILPGIQPTGKYVEIPVVIVMKFEGNKIVYEHILMMAVGKIPARFYVPSVWSTAISYLTKHVILCTRIPINNHNLMPLLKRNHH